MHALHPFPECHWESPRGHVLYIYIYIYIYVCFYVWFQILPPHTVGQFLPFPLPLLGFPPSFPVHRLWATPTMHYWPQPLASLNALVPIFALGGTLSGPRCQYCLPPSFGSPRGWASFGTSRGLDRSFGCESPLSYLGTLARLFGITGWLALPWGVVSWYMPLSRPVPFAPLFGPSSPSLVSPHTLTSPADVARAFQPLYCLLHPSSLRSCLGPLFLPSLPCSLLLSPQRRFSHSLWSGWPLCCLGGSLLTPFPFSSQPSATGGLTQGWLWPPLPRGSPGCNIMAAWVVSLPVIPPFTPWVIFPRGS